MRKVHVEAQYGFHNCYHKADFEFPDNYTDDEIEDAVWDWANQFVEVEWEVKDEDIAKDDDEDDN